MSGSAGEGAVMADGDVVVMQQWAGRGAEGGVRASPPGATGLLVIRADPEGGALADAVHGTLGLALPGRLSSSAADGRCLRWISPDEWLLSCALEEAFDVETRLRAALDGFVSITNVSGGYCVLELEGGAGVRELFARSTSLDVDPRVFGPARVASTVFAKTTATLRNVDGERYELICRRSFAGYIGRWIVEATREGGLVTATWANAPSSAT